MRIVCEQRESRLTGIRRVAVKIGSNVLTRADGTLDVTRMSALTDQVAALHKSGVEVILISSGAVASGRSEVLPVHKLDSVERRQLFSAVGQAKLINRYDDLFSGHGIMVGQVLTTKENFSTRRHYLNQKSCMRVMIDNGVIPIVNENDTVAVSELMFTDNDELAGLVASMMEVQLLVILSNIDGIYDGMPGSPQARVIEEIAPDMDLDRYVQSTKSGFGRGGMMTKTRIARKVAEEGIVVVVANGKREDVLTQIVRREEALSSGEETCPVCPYTRFVPSPASVRGVKRWIAHSGGFAAGEICLNEEASLLVASGKPVSILPVGITAVHGSFEQDDIVRIINHCGEPIGVGKVACSSRHAAAVAGRHGEKPIVHYDYLYIGL